MHAYERTHAPMFLNKCTNPLFVHDLHENMYTYTWPRTYTLTYTCKYIHTLYVCYTSYFIELCTHTFIHMHVQTYSLCTHIITHMHPNANTVCTQHSYLIILHRQDKAYLVQCAFQDKAYLVQCAFHVSARANTHTCTYRICAGFSRIHIRKCTHTHT